MVGIHSTVEKRPKKNPRSYSRDYSAIMMCIYSSSLDSNLESETNSIKPRSGIYKSEGVNYNRHLIELILTQLWLTLKEKVTIFLKSLLSISLMQSIFKETTAHQFMLAFSAPFVCFDFIAQLISQLLTSFKYQLQLIRRNAIVIFYAIRKMPFDSVMIIQCEINKAKDYKVTLLAKQ